MNKKRSSERKRERIVLMVSTKDKKVISRNANRAKCTVSEYLRHVGIKGAIAFEDMTPWMDQIDQVNEIIRIVKQNGDQKLVQEILKVMKRKDGEEYEDQKGKQ